MKELGPAITQWQPQLSLVRLRIAFISLLLEQTTFPAESHQNEMLKSCHTRCGSPSEPISINLYSLYLFIFCHSAFSKLIGYLNVYLPFLFTVLSSLHLFPQWLLFLDEKTKQELSFPWTPKWFSLPVHPSQQQSANPSNLNLDTYLLRKCWCATTRELLFACVLSGCCSSPHQHLWPPASNQIHTAAEWVSTELWCSTKCSVLSLQVEPAQPHLRLIFCLEHWALES